MVPCQANHKYVSYLLVTRASKFHDLNRAARGKLRYQVDLRRERNDSYADIAWWLYHKYGIRVTGEAVRQWHLSQNGH